MFKDANDNIIDVTEHPGYLKLIKERSRTETPQETVKFNLYEHDEHLGMTPEPKYMNSLSLRWVNVARSGSNATIPEHATFNHQDLGT